MRQKRLRKYRTVLPIISAAASLQKLEIVALNSHCTPISGTE